jgi:bifunctional DNA-binding transcriptional regulator/antitoxin component of YhaV-PrlF toxin-antitoxin module
MDAGERDTMAPGERGRLALPARLRRRLDVRPGDRLLAMVDAEGGLRLVSAREQARRLCGLYRDLAPGWSLADELIAERRRAAKGGPARGRTLMEETAGSVLDASALLAYPQGEPGSETVQAALAVGAVINVVNYAEVLSRLGEAGEGPATAHRRLVEQGLIGGLLEVVPLTVDDAVNDRPAANHHPRAGPLPGRPRLPGHWAPLRPAGDYGGSELGRG